MLTGIEVRKSKSKAKVGILVDAREELMKSSTVSATQSKDAALAYNSSQVKRVVDVRRATAAKEKEGLWQLAVERLKFVVP